MAEKTTDAHDSDDELKKQVREHHRQIRAEIKQHIDAIRSGNATPDTIADNLEGLESRIALHID